MKHLYYIMTISLLFLLAACYETDSKTDVPVDDPSAKITHEDGWSIVSKMEDGDRVYWFLAPEVDDVSPAMFKKTVYGADRSELETETVSQCEAPKQTCDDLMRKFKKLSEKYK